MIRERWQKMRNDLHTQVLFIAEAVGLALDDANRVVQAFRTVEGDLSFAADRNPRNEYSSHQVRARFIGRSFH
jgi:hypothetical protein